MKKQLLNLLVLIFVCSCSKDDPREETSKSDLKKLESFQFLAADNDVLETDIIATINESEKLVTAIMPLDTDISNLKPTIKSSPSSTVKPNDETRLDFSNPVKYAIEAEDGSSQIYTINIEVDKREAAKILSFNILVETNSDGSSSDQIYYDIEGSINDADKTIVLVLPEGTLESQLSPVIEISEGANITSSAGQFLAEGAKYTVTAENGNAVTYSIIIDTIPNERKILIDFFNANPNNVLGWDINTLNIHEWPGISVYNNRVSKIELINKNIEIITPGIGSLSKLSDLIIQNESSPGKISLIPNEIGNLTNLRILFLNGNAIAELPVEIGNLVNLDRLVLDSNRLAYLPEEIGNLINLKWLILSTNNLSVLPNSIGNLINITELFLNDNRLTQLPESIGSLPDLKVLRLKNNKLTSVHASIGNMSSLVNIDLTNNNISQFPVSILNVKNLGALLLDDNSLTTLPAELGSMTTLEKISLSKNNLDSLPTELGNLTTLQSLNIKRNPLRTIPQPVCDLETNYGTEILKDNKARCN